jgi:hypothetical protein
MSAPVGFETQWAVRAVDEIVRDSERLRQIKRLLAASPNDLALHMSMIRELDQIVIRCSTDRISNLIPENTRVECQRLAVWSVAPHDQLCA